MGVRDGSVWVTTMPLFHAGGCAMCVLGTVSKRATQVLVEWFDPALVMEFGQTECSPVATVTVPTDAVADIAETIDQPLPHVEV